MDSRTNDKLKFTQGDVDRIVAERLERDRRIRGVSDAQKFTQGDVDRIVAERLAQLGVGATGEAQNETSQATPGEAEAQPDIIATDASNGTDPGAGAVGATDVDPRVRDLELQLLQAKAREILAERGMSTKLGGLLDYSSAEACMSSIDAVSQIYGEAVQEGIDARLKMSAVQLPRASRGIDYSQMSDQEYFALKYGDRFH